jgi:hypothetical protein
VRTLTLFDLGGNEGRLFFGVLELVFELGCQKWWVIYIKITIAYEDVVSGDKVMWFTISG